MLLSLLLLFCLATPASAAIDAYEFSDPVDQHRYEALVDELRCPQCLNTNLSGSDSMIAKDLRREIHRMVTEGRSDDEIREFMYERYGDFILYRPRFVLNTYLLWMGPLVLLAIGLVMWWRLVAQRRRATAPALSDAEQQRLRSLLDRTDSNQR